MLGGVSQDVLVEVDDLLGFVIEEVDLETDDTSVPEGCKELPASGVPSVRRWRQTMTPTFLAFEYWTRSRSSASVHFCH